MTSSRSAPSAVAVDPTSLPEGFGSMLLDIAFILGGLAVLAVFALAVRAAERL